MKTASTGCVQNKQIESQGEAILPGFLICLTVGTPLRFLTDFTLGTKFWPHSSARIPHVLN